ncbi:MAG: hypothetical protein HYR96_07860 [Deltaproteobacteria bacterium]|nr:hypothetical protein [Deltaproteobacteria bacterium]MBI3294491.1 hypothetical protein [Deltaproteobacteria bacterium]
MKKYIVTLFLVSAQAILASGSAAVFGTSAVAPGTLENFSGLVIGAPASVAYGNNVKVQMAVSCYGRNLRSVPTPMDGCGMLHVKLDVKEFGQPITFNIPEQSIPFAAVKVHGQIATAEQGCPPSAPLSVDANSQQIVTSLTMDPTSKLVQAQVSRAPNEIKWDSSGNLMCGTPGLSIKGVTITQTLTKGDVTGYGLAQNGPVTYNETHSVSADGKTILMEISLPGEVGECGGFVSPLMVFLGEARPSFSGKSKFPLYPGQQTFWVEKGAPGYFLALDTKGIGKITQAKQLFGSVTESNGFEALKNFDSNHDGVIDSQDKVFEKIIAWRDMNADGISQDSEMKRLRSIGIESISLNYSQNNAVDYSGRARIFQTAKVKYHNRTGSHLGEVADVWFAKAPVFFSLR